VPPPLQLSVRKRFLGLACTRKSRPFEELPLRYMIEAIEAMLERSLIAYLSILVRR